MKKIKLILLALVSVLVLGACGGENFYSDKAINGTQAFKQKDERYLLYFYMPTCAHCQEFKPTLEEYVLKEDALPIYKVNLSMPNEQVTWDTYKVEGTPTLVLVENGKEIERFVGGQELEDIPTKE